MKIKITKTKKLANGNAIITCDFDEETRGTILSVLREEFILRPITKEDKQYLPPWYYGAFTWTHKGKIAILVGRGIKRGSEIDKHETSN